MSTVSPVAEVGRDQGVPSQYHLRLGTEDELQFNVQIWGQVNKPGLYAVPDGTDLVSLISLAGGPTDDAKLARVVLVRGRESTAGSFTVDLQDFLNSGKRRDVPVLGPGDTVMVPAKFSHNLFRFSGILSVVVLVANVVVTASRR